MATATEIHQRLGQAVERHRRNPNLSDDGKRKLIAKEYVAARRDLQALQQAAQQSNAIRRAAAERRLFGLPKGATSAEIVSFRDAMARVESITDPAVAERL